MDYIRQIEEHNQAQQTQPSKKPDSSNNRQLDSHKSSDNSWVKQAAALFFKSRNMASYLVLALRKQYNSRAGLLACTLMLICATSIYLLNWRSNSKLLTDGVRTQSRKRGWGWGRRLAGVGALMADAFTYR